MRKELIFAVGAAVVLPVIVVSGVLLAGGNCRDFKEDTVTVGSKQIDVAIAREALAQSRGLSGCKKIPANSGMYFPYDPPIIPHFWMKGMVIPVDIVWIADGRVVEIITNLPPVAKFADDPVRYSPPRPVTGVLELGAGKVAEYGIAVGQIVTTPR